MPRGRKPLQPPPPPCEAGGAHHWRIEIPDGPHSRGECRKCGAVSLFPNSLEAAYVPPNPDATGWRSYHAMRS